KNEVGHGKWAAYLRKHFPDLSQRSLNVYMQLAAPDNKAKLDATSNSQRAAILESAGVTSVREALREIRTENEKAEAKAKAEEAKAKAKAAKSKSSVEELLSDLAVDEVYVALERAHARDPEYLWDLAQMILAKKEERDGLNIPPDLDRRPPPTAPSER